MGGRAESVVVVRGDGVDVGGQEGVGSAVVGGVGVDVEAGFFLLSRGLDREGGGIAGGGGQRVDVDC